MGVKLFIEGDDSLMILDIPVSLFHTVEISLSRFVENMLRWQLTNRNQKWDNVQKRDRAICEQVKTDEEQK